MISPKIIEGAEDYDVVRIGSTSNEDYDVVDIMNDNSDSIKNSVTPNYVNNIDDDENFFNDRLKKRNTV